MKHDSRIHYTDQELSNFECDLGVVDMNSNDFSDVTMYV